ncbi:hypothetical protein [Leifsonia sp. A12D58]|uniref:hypothetical protein n=1 Tax=Leifsonia sp. A12D58 TaxID=3397674 RepID=UPI0039E0FF1C
MPEEHKPESGDLDWLQSQLGGENGEGADASGDTSATGSGPVSAAAGLTSPAATGLSVPAVPESAPPAPAPSIVSPPTSAPTQVAPAAAAVWGPGQIAVPRNALPPATPARPVEPAIPPVVTEAPREVVSAPVVEPAEPAAAAFSWGLTPTHEPDPVVMPAAPVSATPAPAAADTDATASSTESSGTAPVAADEPEPWWTTVAQVPLVLTAEEVAASGGTPVQPPVAPSAATPPPAFRTSRFGRRLPGIPAAAAEPLDAPVPAPDQTPTLDPTAVTSDPEVAPDAVVAADPDPDPVAETDEAEAVPFFIDSPSQPETSAFSRLLSGSASTTSPSAEGDAPARESEADVDETALPRTGSGPFGLTPEVAPPRAKAWPERKAAPAAPQPVNTNSAAPAAVSVPPVVVASPAEQSLFGNGAASAGPPTPPAQPPVGASVGGGSKPPAARNTKLLVLIAGGLVAVLVLVGLFFIGQGIGGAPVAATTPTAAASAAPTTAPTPTPEPEVTAPQAAGVHAWNTMFGTECLEPFVSPWNEEFTVVDCATPHTAQLVSRGSFGDDPAAVFPGEAALAAQINLVCTVPGIIDMTAAAAFPDLQLQGSYPVTEDQWSSGQRSYYCFVSRSSGEPLTGSVAGPGPTA